ncbi:carbohydrate ABC transporter permease [Mycoplasma sp. Mirounga ES2805-ORL]|uniref:carbohydrate ABC transporter permease n=1 Tax=Mycoplasma sp. Mirounga ES2805-ORL TaxID=754514 RepID=UPI00197B275D|nr:carbohydrate ABC transporter permease [Mycoplasma sp. Mirounga ES2805-ORL]QSF13886.1 carbohydrate ABC transporter permease [Mycoplasma sp. Mirounga ES2805-ORL]
MFEIKLKIQKKWLDIKLRKNKEYTAKQVRDTSLFALLISSFLKLTALVFFGLIIIFPFAFMLSISLMPVDQADNLKNNFTFWPESLEWSNFSAAASETATGKSYWFSFGLTFTNVLFSIVTKLFVTMLCGYAFSLKQWKGKNIVWTIFIALLVLPEVALLNGQYYVVTKIDNSIGWKKDFMGIITIIAIPFIASIFTALMFRNAFEAIPKRMKEVAMVDRAVGMKYFFKIAVPMVTPTTLTVVILTTIASWNSYLWPALVAGTDYQIMSVWLFGVGRIEIGGEEKILQSIKMAGAILVVAPMFIFYFLFRKRIMRSISRQGSAIKG